MSVPSSNLSRFSFNYLLHWGLISISLRFFGTQRFPLFWSSLGLFCLILVSYLHACSCTAHLLRSKSVRHVYLTTAISKVISVRFQNSIWLKVYKAVICDIERTNQSQTNTDVDKIWTSSRYLVRFNKENKFQHTGNKLLTKWSVILEVATCIAG